MYGQILLKDFFSMVNILLITYLFKDKKNVEKNRKQQSRYSYFLCLGSLFFIRLIENGLPLHIFYNYLTILMIVMVIGHFLFQCDVKYSILVGGIFLSIVLFGELLSCIFFYPYSGNGILAEISSKWKMVMILITEIIIVTGSLLLKKAIGKIPSYLRRISVIIIMMPLSLNIVIMAICADQLYYEEEMIMDNIYSSITILVACIIMFIGTICNIVILENYLKVKKIENETNLQISEISLQYDYYMKQVKDMENIRRLSHDIKNHLEALKGDIDNERKLEYINGIERKLSKYQSYYKTGNAFIDSLLHVKRLEAIEGGIEFKVLVDFTPFKKIRDEDLCVIISNIIDNALYECHLLKEEIPDSGCLIQLKAKRVKNFLSILCENSIRKSQEELLKKQVVWETTKEDKRNHGIGIKNIKHVVQEYGGEVSFHVEEGMFAVSIIIPINL